jgi:hypothetical protein
MGTENKNKVNVSINSIETSAVVFLDKMREEKRKFLYNSSDTIESIRKYIFGQLEDNPFQEVTDAYNDKLEDLREKAGTVAKKEKKSYMGKTKKGVKGIKKIVDELNQEAQKSEVI